ncbi:helix-turn-helix transcriptional regulator [Clostridium cellulovorans]|uniref:Transcriptional regulator, AraC family n=1 Tax=Clostridium cellulovorans (strain ATCC 35296 / DSM 3052 / OCM 3 / 743B) TaxID=573061 RepID=D9SQB7_CLOC7|nr:AraC family transcriptional regulator [Clostridium cellulovorans]ADL50184.1 transcriptional regulator, AraC family [Clostridium cellulovorans 743B]
MFKINYCDYNHSNPDYDQINRPYGSGDYLFLFFLTPMKIKIGEETIFSKENAFILFPKGTPQEYSAVKKFKNSFLHFSPQDDFTSQYSIPVNQIVYLPNPEVINDILKQIYIEFSLKNMHYVEKVDSLINQLFIDFSRQLQSIPYDFNKDLNIFEQFNKARVEILTHIEKDWTSKSMASLTNLGTSQFYNYYRYFFSRSPKSELLDARIARAKYLLKVNKLPVSQVATLSGFNNLSHFTRYFKKSCGITPLEYSKTL